MNATIRAILQGRWLLNKEWAYQMMPAVFTVLKGGQWVPNAEGPVRTGNESMERPFLVEPKTMQRHEMYVWNGDTYSYELNTKNASLEGVVAVVPISGPILKYNGECGEVGSVSRMGWLEILDKMENVTAIVLVWDTPGGMVDGTHSLSSTIKSLKKYSISYVDDGMCCSAGMWGATSAREFYASKETDTVGSIGVLCTLADFTGYYEQLGIKVESIYPPQSEEKNLEYREWLAGSSDLIKADLGVIAEEFIAAISANRPQAVKHASKWNKGATFYAREAKSIGLIDGIMPLSKVIQRAHYKGKNTSNMSRQNSTTVGLIGAGATPMQAVLHASAATELPLIAAGDVASDGGFLMSESQINAIGELLNSKFDEAAQSLIKIADLEAKLAEAAGNADAVPKATHDAAIAAKEEEISTLQGQLAEKDTTISSQANTIAEHLQTIEAKEAQITELGGKPSGEGTQLKPVAEGGPTGGQGDKPSWYQPDGSEEKLHRR